jgi:hypothetical protein
MDPSAGMGTPGNRADAILALAETSDSFRMQMEEFLSKAPGQALSTLGGRDIERLSRFFGRRVSNRLLAYTKAFPAEIDWRRVRAENSAEHAFLGHAFFRERLRETIQASAGSETAAERAAAMGDVSSLKVLIRIGLVTFPDEDLIRAATKSIDSLRYLHEAGHDTAEALVYAFENGNVETARYAHDVIGQRLNSEMKFYADFLPSRMLANRPELQRLFNDNIHEVAIGILRDQNEYYQHAIGIWQAEGGHAGALRKAVHELEQNNRIIMLSRDLDALIAGREAAGDARAADYRARRERMSTQLVKENFSARDWEIDPDEPFNMEDVPPHTTGLAPRGDGRPMHPDDREYLARIEGADEWHNSGSLQRADSMQIRPGGDTSTAASESAHVTSWRPLRL